MHVYITSKLHLFVDGKGCCVVGFLLKAAGRDVICKLNYSFMKVLFYLSCCAVVYLRLLLLLVNNYGSSMVSLDTGK